VVYASASSLTKVQIRSSEKRSRGASPPRPEPRDSVALHLREIKRQGCVPDEAASAL
jgi:hypothetical protein